MDNYRTFIKVVSREGEELYTRLVGFHPTQDEAMAFADDMAAIDPPVG